MITHVAILDISGKVWSLPSPNRHHNVIHQMVKEVGKAETIRLLGTHRQGFLNDKATFLDRKQAFQEAADSGQILPPYNPANPSERRGTPDLTHRELFSEDMW